MSDAQSLKYPRVQVEVRLTSAIALGLKTKLGRNLASPLFWTQNWRAKTRRYTILPAPKFAVPASTFKASKHVRVVFGFVSPLGA